MAGEVLYGVDPGGIGVITFNRPAVRNALNWAAMHALGEAVAQAEADESLRALILTGAGSGAFISGGDLRDLHSAVREEDGLRQHDLMAGILGRLARLPVPVIAAMEGATRGGGCEVALACDLRVAAEDATLGFVQISMAVTPGWGGALRLYRQVGYAQAMDLLLTGRILTAHEALALGLVQVLCSPGRALEAARAVAAQIGANPPLAVRGIKAVLRGYATLPEPEAAAQERAVFGRLWASADHAEASSAFLEKRPPVFRGR
jgi:enoyl-CoA hydratase/carnithine racemase